LFQADKLLARRIMDQLTPETAGRLLALIGADDVPEDEGEAPDLLRMIKSSPGGVSLSTMLAEIGKLKAITAFGLPGNLFAGIAPLVLKEWRDQVMTESPSHTRGHPVELRIALLSALLYCRRREITDALANRLPGAGMFKLFREQGGRQDQFRFGREADGSPAKPWDWEDLD
jgi:hypothetical protein